MPTPKVAAAAKGGTAPLFKPGPPDGAGLNLSQKTERLAVESSQWVSGHVVDILIATAAGIAIALVLLGVRALGCKLLARWGRDPHWPAIFARVLAKTKVYFIILASAELVASHAYTPPGLMGAIRFAFVIAFAIQAAIWARELVLGYLEHKVGASEEHSTLGSAVSLIRLLVTVTLFAIAIVLILSNLGVNVTGLVAGLGVGGIAIGLAAQGIFSDLFAALSIIFDRPFRRGDTISFGTQSGSVEQIGLKTTRLRAVSGEQVVIANAKLLDQQIHNFTTLERRRITLSLGLVCQTPPGVCARIPAMMKEIVEAQERTAFVRCGMIGFGASTLDFDLQFDVHSTNYDEVYAARSAICIAILDRFNREDIQLAYPSQTSFTAAPDGTLIMPYPTSTAAAADAPRETPQGQE